MNVEMAYLIGLICGNGEIKRGSTETIVSVDIPHKKLLTENNQDVKIYVKASISDIRKIVEPLTGSEIRFTQQPSNTILSFSKPNANYLMREILRYVGRASSHENIRISKDIFAFSQIEKIYFLKGFADTTGYIRRSNYFFESYCHRVYLEIPHNWELVVDVCNLLKDVDIPVQNIDWAHPNMRDGNLTKYKQGKPNFWKKEHQLKIWANEFEKIGFAVLHKKEALSILSDELRDGIIQRGKDVHAFTHRYYWEGRESNKIKPIHPAENDLFIPALIRGKHYSSWKEIAKDLGYIK